MPPSSPTNIDRVVLRVLGVCAFVLLMYGVWESINTPDYVIQIPIFFGLLALVVIFLGVGGVAVQLLRASRGGGSASVNITPSLGGQGTDHDCTDTDTDTDDTEDEDTSDPESEH